MLHRILPEEEKNRCSWNKTLAITPKGLKKWITYFKDKGFEFVSMDELASKAKSGKRRAKYIALTIDDGYKDNLIFGLPIFEQLNVPVTIYVSSCFPNQEAVYWWYFLEDYVTSNSRIDLREIGINYYKTYSKDETKLVYDEVRELLRVSDYNTHVRFAIEVCKIKNLSEINRISSLTWEEVAELNKSPLVTIGGHTAHHLSLKHVPSKLLKKEIKDNKEELERVLGNKVIHFAYPYGSLDDTNSDVVSVLKELNYQTAVLNYPGSIFLATKNNYSIPRMGLSDETEVKRVVDLLNGKVHLDFIGLRKRIF